MPSKCSICSHEDRAEIEYALLTMYEAKTETGEPVTIELVAERFGVELNDLKAHAMFHAPLSGSPSIQGISEQDSITRQLKLREADVLAGVANEYFVTLKSLGRRINKLAGTSPNPEEDMEKQLMLAKMLTKPMVDLYIGVGTEIRQTVKTMAELDKILNGENESSTSGLQALAAAIAGSRASND